MVSTLNRFWTLMAFLLARAVVFCKDSPLHFSTEFPALAWFIVVVFTFLVLYPIILSTTSSDVSQCFHHYRLITMIGICDDLY